jgi:hypothetical protein
MPSIVLHCPNCQKAYQMSPELIARYAGKSIACKNCKQPFSFDAAMDAAAQAAGQAEAEAEPADEPTGGAAAGGYDQDFATPAVGVAAAATAAPPAPRAPAAPAISPPAPPAPPAAPSASPAGPHYEPAYAPQPAFPPRAVPQVAGPHFAPPPGPPPGFSPPVGYASGPAGAGFSFGDLFTFRRVALRPLLPVVFWLGVAYCLYNGLGTLSHLVLFRGYDYGYGPAAGMRLRFGGLFDRVASAYGFTTILDSLFWLVLGPLFWRGFCDLILAASRLTNDEARR